MFFNDEGVVIDQFIKPFPDVQGCFLKFTSCKQAVTLFQSPKAQRVHARPQKLLSMPHEEQEHT